MSERLTLSRAARYSRSMVWAGIVFFIALGIVFVIWRGPIAYWQGMIMGGRMPAGCAVAQGLASLLLALLFFLFLRG